MNTGRDKGNSQEVVLIYHYYFWSISPRFTQVFTQRSTVDNLVVTSWPEIKNSLLKE